jgi:serine/threonine protein kinase
MSALKSGSYGSIFFGGPGKVIKQMDFEDGAWIRELAFGTFSKKLKCKSLVKLEQAKLRFAANGIQPIKVDLTYRKIELDLHERWAHLIDNRTILQIYFDVVLAIRSLHQNNWIHGDLKGSNIMVDHQDRGYLIDYSAAFKLLFHSDDEKEQPLTYVPWTSWGFAPPVCWKNPRFLKSGEIMANEVWSLGAVLLSMLGITFECAYQITEDEEKYYNYLQDVADAFHNQSKGEFPQEWILKTMAWNYKDRWTVHELAEALFQFAVDKKIKLLQWGSKMPDKLEDERLVDLKKLSTGEEFICPDPAPFYLTKSKKIHSAKVFFQSYIAECFKDTQELNPMHSRDVAYYCASWISGILMCNNHYLSFADFVNTTRLFSSHKAIDIARKFFRWLVKNWEILMNPTMFEKVFDDNLIFDGEENDHNVIAVTIPFSEADLKYGKLPKIEHEQYLSAYSVCKERAAW